MLLHKGFIGKIEFDDRRLILMGEVINSPDLLEFDGKTADEIRRNFIKCIDDYCILHVEIAEDITAVHEGASIPFIGNYNISLPAERQSQVMRAAKRDGSSMEIWLNRRVIEHLGDFFEENVA